MAGRSGGKRSSSDTSRDPASLCVVCRTLLHRDGHGVPVRCHGHHGKGGSSFFHRRCAEASGYVSGTDPSTWLCESCQRSPPARDPGARGGEERDGDGGKKKKKRKKDKKDHDE